MGNTTSTFGKNMKSLRKIKGYTQEQLAVILNTTRSCISNYELGNRQPDNETISAVADFFNVSIDFLMGRSTIAFSFKSDDDLHQMQQIIDTANNIKELDINHFSPSERCLILKFYEYLLRKEKSNKN